MRRAAQRHRGQAGADRRRQRNTGAARQHQCERSGPERLRQQPGRRIKQRKRFGGGEIGDMDDQRVEIGPPLGAIDAGDGKIIVCARGEAVNRLGRHGDGATGCDHGRRLGHASLVRHADILNLCRGHPLSL